MAAKLRVSGRVVLDEAELIEHFIRAPGPGGQNVNKVATAVQLRWNVSRSNALPDDVRTRLKRLAGRRLTADGVLVIESHRYRTQARNRDDARQRLFELIRAASVTPRSRKPTTPTAASRERRLREKRSRAALKRARSLRDED